MTEQEFEWWKRNLLQEIRFMIDEWEAVNLSRSGVNLLGSGEGTFYSLALRRVYDMIDGRSAFDQLPILETEDTPES